MRTEQTRKYERSSSVVFLKTDAPFGGLSNMAGGYPLRVAGIRILTSEALYQCCRFPHMPEVQRMIIDQKSPMTAKMKVKPYRSESRPDWDLVRVKIMRWCLRVKLAQNWSTFSALLLSTGERPIVEESRKDEFWGAKAIDENNLLGMNVLGRLLMELRELVRSQGRAALSVVEPAAIPNFLLCGAPIGTIARQTLDGVAIDSPKTKAGSIGSLRDQASTRPSLFDVPMVKEAAQPEYGLGDQRAVSVADLKPYAEYRASSHAWIGDVPKHWQVLPNRALFSEVKDRNHPDEEMLSVTITRGIVEQKTLLAGSSKKDSSNLDKSAYKLVQPRDIAYNKMRAWQGAIGVSSLRGIVSPAYVVMRLRADHDLPNYFHHLYRTPQFAKEAERWSYGITSDMWSLRPEHFKNIYTPVPPPAEQAAIVRFLNWANNRLDRTIRAKRKVIALLNEQMQAIIHRAITRGLDPSVPIKDSGITWLGDIPKDWEVLPLKSVCTIQSGITLGKDYSGQVVREYPYLRVANVQAGHVKLSVVKTIRVTKAQAERCMLQSGDMLMTEGGDLDKLGRGCVWNAQVSPCLHQNHVFAVRPDRLRLDSRFLSALMGTSYARAYFQSTAKQTTNLAATNKTKLGMFKILLPGLDEQHRILSRLDEELRPVNRAASRLEGEIDLLREYRTRLVADVVTGKLDVREAAAKLPDEELVAADVEVDDAEAGEDEVAAIGEDEL